MKKLIPLFTSLLLILVSVRSHAQDANFSQYWNTPFLTNPGMLSVKPDMVVSLNYRSQWAGIGTPFTSFMLGGYYPILSKDKYRTFGSAGAFILSDRKPSSSMKTTGFGINGSYKLPLNFANFMHFGIQFSYMQNKLGLDGATTGSQWNGNTYDPNLTINEDPGQSKGVPAVALGAQWVNEDVYGDIRYMAGISAFNLNRPNTAFYRGLGVNDNLSIRYVLTGGIRAVKVQNITLFPSFRAQLQGTGRLFQLGTVFRYGILDGPNQGDGFLKSGSIGIGAWYQVSQAIIGMVEFNQPNYSISFNYDFGASGYKTDVKNSNAAEFFVMYKKTLGRRKKVDIRYYRTREQDIVPITPGDEKTTPVTTPPAQTQPAPTPVAPPANVSPTPSAAPSNAAPAPAKTAPAKAKPYGTAKPGSKPTQKKKPGATNAKPGAKITSGTKPTTAKSGSSGAKPAAKPAAAKPKAGAAKPKSSTAKPKPKK